MPSRQVLTLLDVLAETLSRVGAAFAQAEEHALQSVSRAQGAAGSLAEEVAQMQTVADEHLLGTASRVADAEKARAAATEVLTGAENALQRLRALQAQASAALDAWIGALEHARLRVESVRFEISQAQVAVGAAKAMVVARETEHTAASMQAERYGTLQGGEPSMLGRLEEAAAAREHARMQLRFVLARMQAAQEQGAVAERTLTCCQGGAERAVELARASRQSAQRASGAVALAHESVSLAGLAVTRLQRSAPAVQAAASHTREAAAASHALSEELIRSVALARGVSDAQAARHALHGRGVVALEDVRNELLQRGAAPET